MNRLSKKSALSLKLLRISRIQTEKKIISNTIGLLLILAKRQPFIVKITKYRFDIQLKSLIFSQPLE